VIVDGLALLRRGRRAMLRAARREPPIGSAAALKVRCEVSREADSASRSAGVSDTIALTRTAIEKVWFKTPIRPEPLSRPALDPER
jgi:hypothetical protein